jgi:predicted GTPase
MPRKGDGKTTLVNRLYATNHQSGARARSLTRELYLHDVSSSQHPFSLIDTSGTNSLSETSKRTVLLIKALSIQSWKIILKLQDLSLIRSLNNSNSLALGSIKRTEQRLYTNLTISE